MLWNSTRWMSPPTRPQLNYACDKKQSDKSKMQELQENSIN